MNKKFEVIFLFMSLVFLSSSIAFGAPSSVWITEFGAKGDGTTDNTTMIKSAFDSGAWSIYVPPGDYKTGQLDVPDSVKRIYGEGRLIQAKPGTERYPGLLTVNKVTDLTIDGLTFIGISAGGRASGESGIDITNSSQVTVKNSTFTGFRLHAVHFKGSRNITVENNTIYDVYAGIGCVGSSDVSIRGNHLRSPLYRDEFTIGIALESTDASYGICRNATISNNTIDDYDYAQNILVHAGEHTTISGNVLRNAMIGISANPYKGDIINDITITGNTVVGSTRHVPLEGNYGVIIGGGLGNYVRNVVIANNTISNANAPDRMPNQGGIGIWYAYGVEVKHNNINNSYGTGIVVGASNGPAGLVNIHDNTISRIFETTEASRGIYVVASSSGEIKNNRIDTVTRGIGMSPSANFTVSGNSCSGCKVAFIKD